MDVHKITADKYFPKGIKDSIPKSVVIRRYVFQAIFAVFTMAFIGYFSHSPVYHPIDENHALIKVSFSHPGERKDKCGKLTSEQAKGMTAKERVRSSLCSRERVPVTLKIDVDGKTIYEETKQPGGLSKDGASLFYNKDFVPAGHHEITVQMRDTDRTEGFDYEHTEKVELEPGQNFVIVFNDEKGRFFVY